jgi:hypothetical protein
LHPHEATLHAAQAAQSAALETREAVRELLQLEQDRNRPADWELLRFRQAEPVLTWRAAVDEPTRSFGIYNPTALPVYLGLGGGSPSAAAGAAAVRGRSLVILPVAIAALEIGIDPADQGALAGGVDALVYGLRFTTVQPAFMGAI